MNRIVRLAGLPTVTAVALFAVGVLECAISRRAGPGVAARHSRGAHLVGSHADHCAPHR